MKISHGENNLSPFHPRIESHLHCAEFVDSNIVSPSISEEYCDTSGYFSVLCLKLEDDVLTQKLSGVFFGRGIYPGRVLNNSGAKWMREVRCETRDKHAKETLFNLELLLKGIWLTSRWGLGCWV